VKNFLIAAVQMNALIAKSDGNLKLHESLIYQAAGKKCKLILFPELSITSHWVSDKAIWEAEVVPDGKRCQIIASLAKQHHIYIGAGIAETCNGAIYNSYMIFGPEGYIGHQRKIHASGDEYFYYRRGNSFEVFDLPFCKIGINICFDTIFPESARVLALKGAELIAAPHAARSGKVPATDTAERSIVKRSKEFACKLSSVRAYDNRCYYVYCNQAGVAGKVNRKTVYHAGGVFILNPIGDVVAESRSRNTKAEMVIARLDKDLLTRARGDACCPLTVRRPSAYREIANENI
jgi:predicted amidohydrolase